MDLVDRLSGGGSLEVSNNVSALLLVLDAGEVHLGLGDLLLRVLKVLEEGLLTPDDVGVLVGGGVLVAGHGAGFTAKETVEIGALKLKSAYACMCATRIAHLLVAATLSNGVALSALRSEERLALLCVTSQTSDGHYQNCGLSCERGEQACLGVR